MADPALVIRVAANLDAFRKNWKEDVVGTIETTKGALASMSGAFDGSRIMAQAGATVAAIKNIGGAINLTAEENARANTILEAAIEKYRVLGKEVPPQVAALAVVTKHYSDVTQTATSNVTEHSGASKNLHAAYLGVESVLKTVGIDLTAQAQAYGTLKSAVHQTGDELGFLGKAGLVFGAAVAGWNVGRMIADFTGIDKVLADGTAAFLGWGDATLQASGAAGDAIQMAFQRTGKWAKDGAEALELNTKWLNEHNKAATADAEAQKKAADIAAKAQEDAAKAAEKYAAALLELDTAGHGLKGLLSDLSADVVDAVKFYLQAGVSQESLATAYELSAVQIRAIATDLQHETEAQQASTEAAKAWAAIFDEVSTATKGFQGVLDSIDGTIVDWAKHLLESGVNARTVAEYYGLTTTQVRALQAALQDEAEAQKAADDAARAAAKAAEKQIETYRTLGGEIISLAEKEARRAAGGSAAVTSANFSDLIAQYITSYGAGGAGGVGGADVRGLDGNLALQLAHEGYSFAEIIALMTHPMTGPMPPPAGPRIPGFAGGVQNFSGGLAVVGERGPELVNLPRGSDVIPMSGGAGGVTVNVYVTQPLGSPNAIADAVGDAVMRQLRNQGVRLPGRAR